MPAGRPKNIESPEKLWEYFEQYSAETKSSPRLDPVGYDYKTGEVKYLPREQPLTRKGFEIWLRRNKIIARLDDYEMNKDGSYSEFSSILRVIKDEIYNDKYTGAVCGLFKENIISRDLGLMERTDHTSKGKQIKMPTKLIIERVDPKD